MIPGAVILIGRDGKVVDFEAIGFQDRGRRSTPMSADAIFRIASMSKPITAVAIMMLVEEGKIQSSRIRCHSFCRSSRAPRSAWKRSTGRLIPLSQVTLDVVCGLG